MGWATQKGFSVAFLPTMWKEKEGTHFYFEANFLPNGREEQRWIYVQVGDRASFSGTKRRKTIGLFHTGLAKTCLLYQGHVGFKRDFFPSWRNAYYTTNAFPCCHGTVPHVTCRVTFTTTVNFLATHPSQVRSKKATFENSCLWGWEKDALYEFDQKNACKMPQNAHTHTHSSCGFGWVGEADNSKAWLQVQGDLCKRPRGCFDLELDKRKGIHFFFWPQGIYYFILFYFFCCETCGPHLFSDSSFVVVYFSWHFWSYNCSPFGPPDVGMVRSGIIWVFCAIEIWG